MTSMATIICVADSPHYLIGATDSANNFIRLPWLQDIAVTKSLSQAKQLLRDHKVEVACLCVETAYDEMCGMQAHAPLVQTIYLK